MDVFRVSVSDLLKEPGAERRHKFEGCIEFLDKSDEEIQLTSPVRISIRMQNTGGTIFVKVRAETEARMICSRCLKDYDQILAINIQELYQKPEDIKKEEREDLDLEDEKRFVIVGDEIDIRDLVEQGLILTLPIKPLCDQACKGLCEVCGKNLDEFPHEHAREIDERLSPLAKLIKENKE